MKRKGIILAGGKGTRLYPATLGMSKQMLPIFDKPAIYYPLAILMLSNIQDILIISTPTDLPMFKRLLGSGERFGINLDYAIQSHPGGLAEAFLIGKTFIGSDNSALILGDNIFYGRSFSKILKNIAANSTHATVFAYPVDDPERYGIVEFDDNNMAISIEEKPKNPKSNYAVTGLYFYDNEVVEYVKTIKPSTRNELEITDINKIYLEKRALSVHILEQDTIWYDVGTHQSALRASQSISTVEREQRIKIACLEEIAWDSGWITDKQLEQAANFMSKTEYGQYLNTLLERGQYAKKEI